MNDILLLFFALPVAIAILSIIGQTLINSPIKIAGITFSILLIITFSVADESFLIYTILYTILSYATAWITSLWMNNQDEDNCLNQLIRATNAENLLNMQNTTSSQNTINQSNNINNTNNSCNCRRRF